jgi:hypothetical protein
MNGILADVRRKEAPRVVGRDPDAVLPNGQRAYLNPGWQKFMRAMLAIPRVKVVLYTSRLERNSEPVERLLMPEILMVSAMLHGEECLPARVPSGVSRDGASRESYHPTKTVDAVVDALGCEPSSVIFLDDNPQRIMLEGSRRAGRARVVRVDTYDAMSEGGGSLGRAILDLAAMMAASSG